MIAQNEYTTQIKQHSAFIRSLLWISYNSNFSFQFALINKATLLIYIRFNITPFLITKTFVNFEKLASRVTPEVKQQNDIEEMTFPVSPVFQFECHKISISRLFQAEVKPLEIQ